MKGVGDGKNKQTSRRVSRIESGEIIGSEIMKDHAMPQNLCFIPRLYECIKLSHLFFGEITPSLVEWRMASDEKDYIIEL